jgi:hypothetical protein
MTAYPPPNGREGSQAESMGDACVYHNVTLAHSHTHDPMTTPTLPEQIALHRDRT